jgi:hypothetical protein
MGEGGDQVRKGTEGCAVSYKNPDRQRRYARYWMKLRRKEWFAANGPCKQCGSAERLELDHIDPATKTTHVVWSWAKARRESELAKCQALCHDCHKAKTIAQKSKALVHGTINGYSKHRCRCADCRRANRERCYKRLARIKANSSGVARTPDLCIMSAAL